MEKERLYGIISIVCALWFMVFGIFWTYWLNLFIAYPVGIAGFYFWKKSYDIRANRLNRIALSLLILGLIASIVALFLFR